MNRSPNSHEQDLDSSRALWIDFKGADGMHYALPYHDLRSIEMPTTQELVLRFVDRHVTVHGRNLKPVYDDLLNERASVLEEDDIDWASESDTSISKLTIERIQE